MAPCISGKLLPIGHWVPHLTQDSIPIYIIDASITIISLSESFSKASGKSHMLQQWNESESFHRSHRKIYIRLICANFIGWGTAEYTPSDIKTSVTPLRRGIESGG